MADEREPLTIADRILTAMRQPFEIAGRSVIVGLSMGVEVSATANGRGDELLRRADMAFCRAKAEGHGNRLERGEAGENA